MATKEEERLWHETFDLMNSVNYGAIRRGYSSRKGCSDEKEYCRLHEASHETWSKIAGALGRNCEHQLKYLSECSEIIRNLHAEAEKLFE